MREREKKDKKKKVCMREREREREKKDRKKKVCMREREREREIESYDSFY